MKPAHHPTVVVTGVGVVTPLGPDLPRTWQRLIAGDNARKPVTLFDVAGCRCHEAATAEIPSLRGLDARSSRRWSRATRLAAPALAEALAMAGLLGGDQRSKAPRLSLSVSTTGAALSLGEHYLRGLLARRRGPGRVFDLAHYQAHHQILDLQDQFGFRGPITIIANACASGANAIGHGVDLIQTGREQIVVAGGYEPLDELIYVGFDCLQALSVDQCRPFDRTRNGLMLGEAASFLVLESEAHARQRGVDSLAVVAGYGHGTDLHHLAQPQPQGLTLVSVMRQALAAAQLEPADIGYLNAHGTATPLNDASECAAFTTVFGADQPSLRLSSTKAAIGHTLGAAGAVEAVFAIKALSTGQLPPNLNLLKPEPAVASSLVGRDERVTDLQAVMSVNLGFGGSNAALIFTRPVADDPPKAYSPRSGVGGGQSPVLESLSLRSGWLPAPLAICGVGSVRPEAEPQPMQSLAGRAWPVRRVDLTRPTLARWQREPRIRRASGLTMFMLEAAQQALDTAANDGVIDRSKLGIVGAYHTGVLVPTGRFFQGILKNGQRFASPNLFPETVINSPTSHVAAVLGAAGPCYSVLGDDTAWVSALDVAATWLAAGTVDSALVIGGEELDPMALDAYAAVRWLRAAGTFVPTEGAGAILLQRAQGEESLRLMALADGLTHRNRAQARAAAAQLLGRFAHVDHIWRTGAGSWWEEIEDGLGVRDSDDRPQDPIGGGGFVASAAWRTLAAVARARATGQEWLVPIWGHSEQCAALLLSGKLVG